MNRGARRFNVDLSQCGAPAGTRNGAGYAGDEDSDPRAAGLSSLADSDPITPVTPIRTTQYQFSTATTSSPEEVLDGISAIELPDDLCVGERGSTYLVLGPRPRFYDARLAVALAVLVVLAVLILSAFSVVLIALLPLGALPLVPLFLGDGPVLAVGAVPEDDGSTRVTVHGQAPTRLTAALDLFLTRLPVAEPVIMPHAGNGNVNGANGTTGGAAGESVRAPETSRAE